MQKKNIEEYIKILGFKLLDGELHQWHRIVNNYNIKIDLDGNDIKKWYIDYGNEIEVHRKTISNFTKSENLVVLECVIRLLEKNYPPKNIELEKKWRVGGYLDIYVTDDKGEAYLMIECKTWGKEFNQAQKITLENNYNKEQILNYYLQDQNAKYLCLYTSKVNSDNDIDYLSNIIDTSNFSKANNQNEIHQMWDKVFYIKGIFEKSSSAYNIEFIGITKNDLKPIDHSYLSPENNNDGSIFNRFAEILRRHTISDKSNAYNKIFNLFLCKIVDEDNAVDPQYEMEFQWKYNENPVDVIYRLSDLHKRGMQEYMDLQIADVSEDDFDKELLKLATPGSNKTDKIKEMFKQLRLYKNNEFAFKEVINERTFQENSEIVKEVVKLLEPYKIKYEHKQKFLGDFFERLLNIGVKQESGQFFTPSPITTFICNSIPFETIIDNKLQDKEANFLPYIIDYACGSGHFLNDAMDRIDNIVQNIPSNSLKTRTQRDNLYSWKRAYKWANEFVYGIEKDYRLAKTTKVACFLNGDGEAKIIYGDGLAPFNSGIYKGKLKTAKKSKLNPVFDTIIANPPFSVESFRMVLENGHESFDLFDEVSDKSDDIECFFIERTYQLLKEGGFAGIILPSTTLLNGGIHKKARKILLENFKLYGVCEFGNKAFTYAGQKTIALFLEKRKEKEIVYVETLIDQMRKDGKDFAYNNHSHVVDKYLEANPLFESFEIFLEKIKEESIWKEEKQKLKIFLLNLDTNVVSANAGDKDEMKRFLGYEHSSMSKYEGIHPFPYNKDGKINSMLYNDDILLDENKLNTLIYKNFLGQKITIPDNLKNYTEIKTFNELVDYTGESFDYKIELQSLENPYLDFDKYPLTTLAENNICEILDHLRKPVKKSKRGKPNYPYYGASGESGRIEDYLFDEKLVLIGEDGAKWGIGEPTGYLIEGKSWVNNHAHIIRTNKEKLLDEYLELLFTRLDFSYLKTRPNGGKLQKGEIIKIKFPLPPIHKQLEIVQEIKKIKGKSKWQKFDEILK